MRALDKVRLRLRSLLRRRGVERELEAELRFHLDQLIEENITSGMAPEEARTTALRTIGGITQFQEECRGAVAGPATMRNAGPPFRKSWPAGWRSSQE